MNFASLARYNIILTGLFLNDSLAWWIAYEVLSRVYQFVSRSRLILFLIHYLGAQQLLKLDPPTHFLVAWPAHNLLIV